MISIFSFHFIAIFCCLLTVFFSKSYAFQSTRMNIRHLKNNIKAKPLSLQKSAHVIASDFKTIDIHSLLHLVHSIAKPALIGGFLSGGLHAITGPDHLAAVLPASVGKHAKSGIKVGAIWGLGHGISAMLIGGIVCALKDKFGSYIFNHLEKFSQYSEYAVSLSLIAIGGLGLYENLREGSSHPDEMNSSDSLSKSTGSFDNRALFINGLLHGLSWDGATTLAPALAMPTLRSAIAYLLAYSIGTISVMSIASGVVGEASTRLGKLSKDPNLPKKMSTVSSAIAMLFGITYLLKIWMG